MPQSALMSMSTLKRNLAGGSSARGLLNKVPEITVYFWVIKVLCTTVGETASDYLTENVGLALTTTTFHHWRAPRADARVPVPGSSLRPWHLLARRGAHQRRRDADRARRDTQAELAQLAGDPSASLRRPLVQAVSRCRGKPLMRDCARSVNAQPRDDASQATGWERDRY